MVREEQSNHLKFAKLILKVLYSPFRAFEEIVKEPTIKGPLLILLITLPITVAVQQISSTRFFIETPMPEHDEWTEKPSDLNSLLWISNGNLTFDGTDRISGNYSVSTSSINNMEIWMRLTGIHALNIVDEDYSRLSISVKFTSEPSTRPMTALLQLFSSEDQSGFNINIEPLLEATIGDWSNITVNLMTEQWTVMGNEASWDDITAIGCLFTWADSGNITVRIDQLYLGRYISFSSATTLYTYIGSIFRSAVDFLLGWLILSGIVLLVLRGLSGWGGSWRKLLSIIGYTYSSSIVYLIVLMLLFFFFLPPIFIPYDIEDWQATEIYQERWGNPISILSLIFYVWATVLCGVALKKIADLSWAKAFFVGLGAVMLSLLFSSFLLSALFILG